MAQFAQVLAIAVPPADAWSGRARAYFDLQQWERAIADFSKAIELAPKVQTNWFHRGLSYVQLGQWDKAAADFDKASEGWPADAESWYWRGAAHARMAQPDEAVRCLRQAVAHGFKDARRMRSNVNFETLRAVDDYKKLLTDLDKVAHPVPTTQKSGN